MPDATVRVARAGDLAALAEVQVRAWRRACADVLPAAVLTALDVDTVAASWRAALASPPTHRHVLLVALGGDGSDVVGFAAVAPSQDDDLPPVDSGELLALAVDPEATGVGHGSRLLAASVDTLRAHRVRTAVSWLFEADHDQRRFLESAGWSLDGTVRTLDLGTALRQVRLHADLQEAS